MTKRKETFFHWAKKYVGEDSPEGDFANDMVADKHFPKLATKFDTIEAYLLAVNACYDAQMVFSEMYITYRLDCEGK